MEFNKNLVESQEKDSMGGAKWKLEPTSANKLLALSKILELFQRVGCLEFVKKFEQNNESLVK